MNKKHFWRRSFAYVVDILVCGLLTSIVVISLNGVFSTNILAPALIKSTTCEIRDDLFTAKRMNELLPLEEGQKHQQILCKQTNMLTNSFFTTQLQKVWTDGKTRHAVRISYYSDENGKQVAYISSEPFFYLFTPLLLALFLTRQGQTPGKRLLRLTVYNNAFGVPDLKSALKREYLKAIFFVIPTLLSFYTMFSTISFDIDETAKLVQTDSAQLEQFNFLAWAISGAVITAIIFWFHFGSFIRWRGQTYWDKFAKLETNLIDKFNMDKSLNE